MKKLIEDLRTSLKEGGFFDKAVALYKTGTNLKKASDAVGGRAPGAIPMFGKSYDATKKGARALMHGDVGKARQAGAEAATALKAGAKPAAKAYAYYKGKETGDKASAILDKTK